MNKVIMLKNVDPEVLGLLPHFLDNNDPRSAREQFDDRYRHGGGWHPMTGWTMNPIDYAITYHDAEEDADETYQPIALMRIRHDVVYFYPDAWVAIVSKQGSLEVARMD